MPSITKDLGFEVYRVRANHDWATIAIAGWQAPSLGGGELRECGEILINSSFGQWAYTWGHLGIPFKKWLAEAKDPAYLAGKFLGSEARKFDGTKTVNDLYRRVIEWRKDQDLTKEQARKIWNWIDVFSYELQSDESYFCEAMQEGACAMREEGREVAHFFSEPWDQIRKSINPDFAAFWQQLWPTFKQTISEELAVHTK